MKHQLLWVVLVAVLVVPLVGCDDMLGNSKYVTPEREARGMIYILPGIQGPDGHYQHVRNGLVAAGVTCGIKIHPWGSNMLANETDTKADRRWGQTIAKEIMVYQAKYPGQRPEADMGLSQIFQVKMKTAVRAGLLQGRVRGRARDGSA